MNTREPGKNTKEPRKTVAVPSSIHQAAKVEAAKRDVDLRDLVAEALASYLGHPGTVIPAERQ